MLLFLKRLIYGTFEESSFSACSVPSPPPHFTSSTLTSHRPPPPPLHPPTALQMRLLAQEPSIRRPTGRELRLLINLTSAELQHRNKNDFQLSRPERLSEGNTALVCVPLSSLQRRKDPNPHFILTPAPLHENHLKLLKPMCIQIFIFSASLLPKDSSH